MKFNGINISVRGFSHIVKNTPCQDSSRCFFGGEFAVGAVSDGHGSSRHFRSAVGSEIAVRTAIRTICDFFERNSNLPELVSKNPEKSLRKIEANILLNWYEEINAHLRFNAFNDEEKDFMQKESIIPETAYGATLIVGVLTKFHCFGFQIGDGGFLLSIGDDMFFPVPDDLRLVANFTTSLCDGNAIDEFRHFCVSAEESDCGIFLCTDGLVNSFSSEDDFISFSKRLIKNDMVSERDALKAHLSDRSEKGSRDDISLSVLLKGKE